MKYVEVIRQSQEKRFYFYHRFRVLYDMFVSTWLSQVALRMKHV